MTGSLVRLVAQSLIGVLLTQLAIVAYACPALSPGALDIGLVCFEANGQ